MNRIWIAACLCVALLAAAAVPAEAKLVRYSGMTSQGLKVKLRTNAKGKAQRFSIRFDPDCDRGDFDGIQRFVAPFRQADFSGFKDAGSYEVNYDDPHTYGNAHVRVEGHRVDGDRLRGTFTFKAKYFDHGEQFNACRTPRIRWSVSR